MLAGRCPMILVSLAMLLAPTAARAQDTSLPSDDPAADQYIEAVPDVGGGSVATPPTGTRDATGLPAPAKRTPDSPSGEDQTSTSRSAAPSASAAPDVAAAPGVAESTSDGIGLLTLVLIGLASLAAIAFIVARRRAGRSGSDPADS